jgi:hypothetical protein
MKCAKTRALCSTSFSFEENAFPAAEKTRAFQIGVGDDARLPPRPRPQRQQLVTNHQMQTCVTMSGGTAMMSGTAAEENGRCSRY